LFEELQFDADWQKVIESTRPPEKAFDLYAGYLDYQMQWFATWYQRCMPFPAIAESVCRRVRRKLRRIAWHRYGSTVDWTFAPV
jgi:hypothetical protein